MNLLCEPAINETLLIKSNKEGIDEAATSKDRLGEKPLLIPCEARIQSESRYREKEVSCFIEIIEQKLKDALERRANPLVYGNNFSVYATPAIRDYCRAFSGINVRETSFTEDVCAASFRCVSVDSTLTDSSLIRHCTGEEVNDDQNLREGVIELLKESEQGSVQDTCGSCKPIILRHKKSYKKYSHVVESEENFDARSARLNFKIDDVDKLEHESKWGKLDVADRIQFKYRSSLVYTPISNANIILKTAKDLFEEIDRFSRLNKKDFATLCRTLFRWSYRLSTKWQIFTSHSHVVIHLPSIGFPYEIRRRALKIFDKLQNLQITRLGWLANEQARVLYVLPRNQGSELITLLRDLVKNVRPDINLDRLWIIQSEDTACSKTQWFSNSRALYQNSKTYRRVKMLTAGCQAFLIPGVMDEIDVFIAAELRTPIMGPPLKVQNHFLNKSNVFQFLQEVKIAQPPFIPDIHNLSELCQGLTHLMIAFPRIFTWLIKLNYGFSGLQTASISFDKSSLREIIAAKKCSCKTAKKALFILLMEILPGQITLNKNAYKNCKEFFCDLEKYGGLVQACPYSNYRVVSLGVFLENDTTKPKICASSDVFHDPCDFTADLGYGIPQTSATHSSLEDLGVEIGVGLREWQYVGYFGLDIIVFTDEDRIDQFWVVDIDPYYTDVIAFTDWIRFCLGGRSICKCCQSSPDETTKRYAMCSGKLYNNGLAKYCGSTLVRVCEERNVRYNNKIKQGSMICPIDCEHHTLGLISLHPKRFRAIQEFTKSLRVLYELSLEKQNGKIETNMLKFARELEKRELQGVTGKSITGNE